jgi:hypothetical protein
LHDKHKQERDMLAIKHIDRGIETVYLAHEATFRPSEEAAKCFTRSPIEAATEGGCVNIIRENGVLLGLVGGTVYVMNESGKTVAKYVLNPSHPATPA